MRYPIEALTGEEVRSLIVACSGKSSTGLRNRALLAVLYRGGLRLGEALALLPKDCEGGTLRVLHGKGDKSRVVAVDPGAWGMLGAWLERRGTLEVGGRDPVFCTLGGGRLAQSYVRNLLKQLALEAGVEKRVHAHGLRHAMACELSAEGVPVHLIRDQLGHSNVATTDRYLRRVRPLELMAAVRNRVWEVEVGEDEWSGIG